MAFVSRSLIQPDQGEVLVPGTVPLNALPFPAALLNRDAVIAAANSDWSQVYGESSGGQHFQRWCEVVHAGAPSLSATLLAGAQRALGHGERFVQKYGEGDRFRITISPCETGALVVHQDLSPTPEGIRAQKMEIMGRLVAGVAHDFANLITLIDGYCDILQGSMRGMDPLQAELKEVRKAVSHGSRLTSQLLDFTRAQTAPPAALDVNVLIREMNLMLRPIIGEKIILETVLAPDLDQVVADPGEMEQVLVNLILNARDAMPTGGTIRVSTANTETGVTLAVADTGRGISPDDMPHVFEPFFTTKESGKGTGLGLSTINDIVRKSGGEIRVQSQAGRGATFTIHLPGARHIPGSERASRPQTPQTGQETVLLVEDEDSVRRLLGHMLHNRGYRVLEAANAAEALPVFESRAAEIDLVLTDIVMPGMSGVELADRLRQVRPDTPIVFMSGYSGDMLTRTGPLPEGMVFLPKPLHPDVLAAKVREALDSSSRPFNPR